MWRGNKWHEVEVSIYNEKDPTDLEGGKAIRDVTTLETARIFPLKEGTMFFHDEDGRFAAEGLKFQISKKQASDLSFTIEAGRTFIEYNGNTYRIVQVLDYTHVRQIRVTQCKSVKILNVD